MIGTDLQIAVRNLAQHTRRNLLLGFAIAAVTGLLVVLSALGAGIRGTMLESASILLTGHVNVAGFYKVTSGTAAPLVTGYEAVLEKVKKNVPELAYASARGRGYAKAVSDTGSMDLILGGLDIENEAGFRRVVTPIAGSLDELAKPGTILLFEDQAKRLSVEVGDSLTLAAPTERGMNNTADVRVAVVAKNIGLLSGFSAFAPNELLLRLYQLKPGTTGAIHLYLNDPAVAPTVAARLRTVLADGWTVMEPDARPYWDKMMNKVNSESWIGQRIDVTTWEDEMSFMSWLLSAVSGLSGMLIAILMVIVVIGIMNTMWIAIRERTREIGTLRAIGMQRRRVLWLFILEAGLLGLGGSIAGALLGAGFSLAITAAQITVPESVQVFLLSRALVLSFGLADLIGAVLVIGGITTAAAVFPAVRAARLRPVTAMHHIG